MSDMAGGFEVDGPAQKAAAGITGAPPCTSANNHLRQGNLLFCSQPFLRRWFAAANQVPEMRVVHPLLHLSEWSDSCCNTWPDLCIWSILSCAHSMLPHTIDRWKIHCWFILFPLTELDLVNKHFQCLSSLPVETRSSLLQQITKVMEDRAAISSLQSVVSGTERLHQY